MAKTAQTTSIPFELDEVVALINLLEEPLDLKPNPARTSAMLKLYVAAKWLRGDLTPDPDHTEGNT